jgi:protein-L-isoaspartate(D-aspartate) O-methyltransferase
MKRFLLFLFLGSLGARCQQGPSPQKTQEREEMVQTQIIARGVADTATLRAMRTVPRHEFVPYELRQHAYDDYPLQIGYEQTISQPYIVAFMTEQIRPRKGQRVLEIGTGSGYQAAVLAEIVDSVFTIELIGELAESAAARLRKMGYRNVLVHQGDGYQGWPEHAPFDAILVTAAAEEIPQPLLEQLKDGGTMVIPVGGVSDIQSLTVVRKRGDRVFKESILPVKFVPLIHPR